MRDQFAAVRQLNRKKEDVEFKELKTRFETEIEPRLRLMAERALLRVLHAELDEHKRKQTMSIAEYAKTNHKYQKLLSRFGQYGAEENAAFSASRPSL